MGRCVPCGQVMPSQEYWEEVHLPGNDACEAEAERRLMVRETANGRQPTCFACGHNAFLHVAGIGCAGCAADDRCKATWREIRLQRYEETPANLEVADDV